ncbi:hypothetical protein E2562_035243 [Oryza meyeriana var. granulata]|uniref:Uncharacterized protein n=1 Tax=Oryza meyeriana var. granulata TaxID=110450 RepID=A0A6G1CKT7_9ORYZ|nr:hypothetical protein E2562_035243 [Oryza meyeriana var. granulata]
MKKKKHTMSESAKDGSVVDADNIITVTLDDLSNDERQEVERRLEEEKMEDLRKILAGYQKTQNGVVEKVIPEVRKPTCTEEIAHFGYVSVASKYGAHMDHMS